MPSSGIIAFAGLVALAAAMGIGRFAFTPVLPMMQAEQLITLTEGGWLASANYLGYLIGGISAARIRLHPAALVRLSLVIVLISTAAMGVASGMPAWIALRLIAGVASAWVLVSVSAWCLGQLAARNAPADAAILGSRVFAGVGAGIAIAGLACLALAYGGASAAASWLTLGAIALAGTIVTWSTFARGTQDAFAGAAAFTSAATNASAEKKPLSMPWKLIFAYGLFGFGYILPATFIPAQARQLVADPLMFGMAWPVFGVAAAVSTGIAGRLAAVLGRRTVWMICCLIMAAGVLLPAFWKQPLAIVTAALCVGGTFMVITMVGLQEARAIAAEAGGDPRPVLSAMTAAFATGQIAGPIVANLVSAALSVGAGAALDYALWIAAASLILSIVLLLPLAAPRGSKA